MIHILKQISTFISKINNYIKQLQLNPMLPLIIIILIGFIIRLYFALNSSINFDEGNLIYGANLLLDGYVPYRDYITRSPAQLVLIATSIKIFGESLFAGRFVSVILTSLSIFLLYKIGTKLYDFRVGLLAALFYSLSPFVVYTSYIVKLEPNQAFFIIASVYALIKGFETNKTKYYFLNGALIGIAIMVRRSAMIYPILIPFILYLALGKNFKAIFEKGAYIATGVFLTFIVPLLYLISQTDVQWMNIQWMGGALGGPAIVSLNPQEQIIELTGNKIINNLVTLALYLFAPSFLFLSFSLRNVLKENVKKMYGYILSIFLMILAYYLYEWRLLPPKIGYGVLSINDQNTWIFAIMLLCFTILAIFYLNNSIIINEKTKYSNKILIWWFLSTTSFYVFIKKLWYVDYFAEFTPVMSLMSSVALITIFSSSVDLNKVDQTSFKSRRNIELLHRYSSILYAFLVVISAIFAANVYHSVDNPDRGISMSTNMDVSCYIKENTLKNEPIFTAVPVFAVGANRPIIYNIAHPLMYITPREDPMHYDPNNIVPNTSEIINYLDINKIKYVVADERTKAIFLSDKHPDIRNYILSHYMVETIIDNVEIYRFVETDNSIKYSDSFETERWKEDSYSFYGIERGTTFGARGSAAALYPIVTDEITFIKYVFNYTTQIDSAILEVTGNKRENMHSCTVWISQDNLTYEQIIEFNEVADTTKKVKISNYTKENQIWLEFRMFKNSTGENTPRIYNFAITANSKNNKSVEIKPYKKEKEISDFNELTHYNPANLLTESSFEHYKDSKNTPIAWSFTSSNSGTADIDDTGFDGNYSLRVSVQNSREGVADMSQLFDLSENEYYRINATHKQYGSGNAIILVQWFSDDWKLIREDKLDLAAKEQWDTGSIEKITPLNTKHGKVILRYETKAGDSGMVWFDDIKLQAAIENSRD